MTKVKCVSVIDESANSSSQAVFDADWASFRANYPYEKREFYLLQPGRPNFTLMVPSDYIAEQSLSPPGTYGPTQVSRDNGNTGSRSDWFAICDFDELPPGSVCSVAIDTSGSMRLSTVQASYDYFIQRCAAAEITVVFDLRFPNERWIPPHNKDIPPSVTISVSPTSYQLGGTPNSSVLSWDVFGDFDTATITADQGGVAAPDEDIGEVSGPGNQTVNPTETTTYTLVATGPAGTSTAEVTLTVTIPPKPTVTFSADPVAYINPGSSTLEWTVTGILVSSVTINQGIGEVGLTGNSVVQPTASTEYTLTATNPGGSTTVSRLVTVYQPVDTVIFASPNPIVAGQNTTLTWSVSGDADTASIDQGIGTVLFNSNTVVSPSTTTTYTLSASGNGGSDSASITVSVCQTPELSASFPTQINFGYDFNVDVDYRYASGGVEIEIEYQSAYGVLETETRTLPATDFDDQGESTTNVFSSNIPWDITGDDAGPAVITYTLRALQSDPCSGDTVIGPYTVNVNIDIQADNINIPDSLEQIPSADPVVSPDDDTVLSDPIEITDIDINVEIKSNKPIQVRFDEADPTIESNWKSLREIT